MTRKEAIKICSREKEQIQQALDACADGDNYVSPDGTITALDYVEAMDMAISALREKPHWISVTERLPDDNEKVIVYTRSGKVCVARWSVRQDKFVSSGNLTVTHWMPLPDEPITEVRCEFAENGLDGN